MPTSHLLIVILIFIFILMMNGNDKKFFSVNLKLLSEKIYSCMHSQEIKGLNSQNLGYRRHSSFTILYKIIFIIFAECLISRDRKTNIEASSLHDN